MKALFLLRQQLPNLIQKLVSLKLKKLHTIRMYDSKNLMKLTYFELKTEYLIKPTQITRKVRLIK